MAVVGFLIRRTGQAIIVLFIVTVGTLALIHLFPGGPIHALLGPRATPQQIAYYNQLYGFDRPFYEQYIKWAGQFLHGNWGFSRLHRQGLEIVDFTLDRIWRCVATLSSASTIIGEHREVLGKDGRQLRGWSVFAIAESAVHDDQRRTRPPPGIGDGRAVARSRRSIFTCRFHCSLS